MLKFTPAENLAALLVEKTGSVWGEYRAKMTAAEQRELFGRYLGKGLICIDGEKETVSNRVVVAFGADYDYREVTSWRDL